MTILLLLVGIGGFAAANVVAGSVAKTSAADEQALGQQDPAAAAKVLSNRIAPIKDAYETYAAASLTAVSARRDVILLFNEAKPPSTPGSPAAASAKLRLPSSLAAYTAAIERENVARKAYTRQLALLMAVVHP
jgi:Tfp pilus assembly protein PilV